MKNYQPSTSKTTTCRDFERIKSVIEHPNNKEIHLEAMHKMIYSFWKTHKNLTYYDALYKLILTLEEKFFNECTFNILNKNKTMEVTTNQSLDASASLDLSITISTEDEPIAIRIVPSGWAGPQTYHVIIEYGDLEQSDYLGILTAQQIKDRYDLIIDDSEMNMPIKTLHNDQELGKRMRSMYNQLKTQKLKL